MKSKFILILMFIAVFASACSSNNGKALLVGTGNNETFTETFRYFWIQNVNGIQSYINRGLIKLDPDMKNVHPALAESYDVSNDGLTYTFTLHDGLKWHDGKELTAEDVKWSMETAIKVEMVVDSEFGLNAIKGYESFKTGKAGELEGVVYNGRTITIKLGDLNVAFLQKIAAFEILPKHILEDANLAKFQQDPYWLHPIGNGPYKIKEVRFGEYALLEAFEGFVGPQPKIKEVIYQQIPKSQIFPKIQAGELDYIGGLKSSVESVEEIDALPDYKAFVVPQIFNKFFTVNLKGSKRVQDIKVRQAFIHALDRKAIINETLEGKAQIMNSLIPPEFEEHNSSIKTYDYNPERTKQLLKEAGFDFNKPITIAYYSDDQASVDLLNTVAYYLGEVGVQTEIKLLTGDLLQLIYYAPEYDFLLAAYSGADPFGVLESVSGNSLMYKTIWEGFEGIETELQQLRKTLHMDERVALIKKIDRIHSERLYQLPLFHENVYNIVNVSRLKTAGIYGNEWYNYEKKLEEWELK
ncbi:ABC transporter substrate-binding protein [Paenibacillus oceani]|uniref:ABC transporter substrate-binding protein n=1 Tax=Paenibacillus oceani TaxID=2772510 RepID=A0A927CFM5_9BACL|nr:ABC transporter substrate-binding protein [Paenibacillus oceani]MBD2865717.1 ABC transporter substrate-binding protein [Paenibacillus oceani]